MGCRGLMWVFLATHVVAAEAVFTYDKPDQWVPVSKLENPLFYDGSVAVESGKTFLTWLEFQPARGDVIWFCARDEKGNWLERQRITPEAGDYANPTLTVDAEKNLWLSYEAGKKGDWNVFVEQRLHDGSFSAPVRVNPIGKDANIHHRATASPRKGIWIAWQGDAQGQFEIFAREIPDPSNAAARAGLVRVSDSPWGDWHPSIAVTPAGKVVVAWDSYDGTSYNIRARVLSEGRWGDVLAVTSSPRFNANAQVISDRKGRIWLAWEEDGPNWGKTYRPRDDAKKEPTRMADDVGSLHRFRKLHLAELTGDNRQLRSLEIPQPLFATAGARDDAPPGIKQLGVFYKSPQLAVDGHDRLWLVYRHLYMPMMGITLRTHVQSDWGIYARCLENEAWSKSFRLAEGQGDALQRISVTPRADGISLAWTFGRTDRRNPQNWEEDRLAPDKVVHHVATKGTPSSTGGEAGEGATSAKKTKVAPKVPPAFVPPPTEGRGIALAAIDLDPSTVDAATRTVVRTSGLPAAKASASARPPRPAVDFNGRHYELFHGDLHRHTDISLCMSPSDGTMDDAYRYGIDAGGLDFIGITDHTHDIAMGDPLSLLWQRIRKEVDRHALAGVFIPFYSYERSRGETDHNVISLRDDILRPHTYPHPQFWQELDGDTFTIAHQPFFNAAAWGTKDPVHRPLLEIYQGFRNHACEADAQQALATGNEVGFIASSDHLSTGASYASVWAEKPTRESLFRALQARRTFAAMDKMLLRVTCGEHWMGEKFSVTEMPPIDVVIGPTTEVQKVEVFIDGAPREITFTRESARVIRARFLADKSLTGAHSIFVRVKQADGNMAWSSPMWVDIQR
jgi:hypothetical protein